MTLAELQAQLFAADVRESGQRIVMPGLVLLCGAALGLACFPIALVPLAPLLIQVFTMSYAAGFWVAVAVGMVLSALLCAVGWSRIREHMRILQRSQQELFRNLRWIQRVLERKRITRKSRTNNNWRNDT